MRSGRREERGVVAQLAGPWLSLWGKRGNDTSYCWCPVSVYTSPPSHWESQASTTRPLGWEYQQEPSLRMLVPLFWFSLFSAFKSFTPCLFVGLPSLNGKTGDDPAPADAESVSTSPSPSFQASTMRLFAWEYKQKPSLCMLVCHPHRQQGSWLSCPRWVNATYRDKLCHPHRQQESWLSCPRWVNATYRDKLCYPHRQQGSWLSCPRWVNATYRDKLCHPHRQQGSWLSCPRWVNATYRDKPSRYHAYRQNVTTQRMVYVHSQAYKNPATTVTSTILAGEHKERRKKQRKKNKFVCWLLNMPATG